MSVSEAYGIHNKKRNKEIDKKSRLLFVKTSEKSMHSLAIDLMWSQLYLKNKVIFEKKIEEIIKNNSRHIIMYDTNGFIKFNKKLLPPNFLCQVNEYNKTLEDYFLDISKSRIIMLYFRNASFDRVNIRYIVYNYKKISENKLSISYTIK